MKDFIEHLRKIHFTLVLVCFATLATISFQTDSAIQRAFDQIRTINDLINKWDENFLITYSVKKNKTTNNIQTISVSWNDKFYHFSYPTNLHRPYPLEKYIHSIMVQEEEGVYSNKHIVTDSINIPFTFKIDNWFKMPFFNKIDKPQSLSEFKILWDNLNQSIEGIVFTGFKSKVIKLQEEDPKALAGITIDGRKYKTLNQEIDYLINQSHKDSQDMGELKIYFNELGDSANDFSFISYGGIRGAFPGFYEIKGFLIYPAYNSYLIHGQQALIGIHNSNILLGEFDDVFFELNKITNKYQDLSLDKIVNVLKSEEGRSRDLLELFGVKIPSGEIIKWIVPIILTLQLYFFIHLNQFINT